MNTKTPELAIIIPTLNEAENLLPLVSRIEATLQKKLSFEIIVVDDHSTDATAASAKILPQHYPVRFFNKKGKKGKAYSLLEGFTYTDAPLIAFIDGDLQYPPEALPDMLQKIDEGADIVVANRIEAGNGSLRNITSTLHRIVINDHLHDLKVDVQSGLKLFKSEIIQRIKLNPKSWTFDLEFLVKARNAGYIIDEVDITFSKRTAGVTKVSFLGTSFQLLSSAISLRMKGHEPVPFLPEVSRQKGQGFHYKSVEYVNHTDLPHHQSAFTQLVGKQKLALLIIFSLAVFGLLLNWHTAIVVLVAILTFLYFADLLFNFFLIYRSFLKTPEIKVSRDEIEKAKHYPWPNYTIFCPLYKEWEVVPQFIKAISALDYPKDKLQIMLLLEEDDKESIEKIRELDLPKGFIITVVPHSLPKTKPKAMNYGLKFATGEYIVIYDAEDVPDPLQLKKAILAFEKVSKRVVCIQAKLNFYNPHQNLLTRVFTAEYSLWFDLVLTGLQSIHAPIPLGGTSNHFKTAILKELKGWDSFNVTEDCDLGMRLVKNGYQTSVIDSITHEEANSNLGNWFNQRTRWIKGYIQSYFVHMRRPQDFLSNLREPHAVTFQLIVGGKIMSMFINPIMWAITVSYFVFRPIIGPFIESFYPTPVLYMGLFSLIIGNFLYMYYYMIGCYKREEDAIIKYVIFVPLYWLAMSVAAWRAVYQVIRKPHYWAKTKHGLHLKSNRGVKESEKVIAEKRAAGTFAPAI